MKNSHSFLKYYLMHEKISQVKYCRSLQNNNVIQQHGNFCSMCQVFQEFAIILRRLNTVSLLSINYRYYLEGLNHAV